MILFLGGFAVIKLKGMPDSMLRCIVSENLQLCDFAPSFEEIRKKGEGFLPGARVVLDFGARVLSKEAICRVMTDFIWPANVEVAAWITYDVSTQELLKQVGLPIGEPSPFPKNDAKYQKALKLDRSLRSGQRVEHPGDIIVAGHVNDGAEVFASGNVTVLGRLHGLVHAGVMGDETAAVVARSMEARQVRIAGLVGSLERNASWWGKPVIVKVDEGSVLIDFWPLTKAEETEKTD